MATFYQDQQTREFLGRGEPSQGYSQPIQSRKYYSTARYFLIFSVIVLVLVVCDLHWPRWTFYCSLSGGLTGYNFRLQESVEYWADYDLFSYSYGCGDTNTNTQRLEAAGIIMLIFGVASILLTLVAMVYMIVFLFRPEFSTKRAFSVILISGAGLWILATLIYLIIYLVIANDVSGTQVQEGLGVAFGIGVLYIGLVVHSRWVLKAFSQ